MNQFIFSLFVVVALIAMVACVIGAVGGHLFKDIDKKITSKLKGKRRNSSWSEG